ncbi:MAG TPA: hypothetical protein VFS21_27440 [Roseiflexaceae bacterium]|nr:hypothetical protein [Roseiflexaceae bacterium]
MSGIEPSTLVINTPSGSVMRIGWTANQKLVIYIIPSEADTLHLAGENDPIDKVGIHLTGPGAAHLWGIIGPKPPPTEDPFDDPANDWR